MRRVKGEEAVLSPTLSYQQFGYALDELEIALDEPGSKVAMMRPTGEGALAPSPMISWRVIPSPPSDTRFMTL